MKKSILYVLLVAATFIHHAKAETTAVSDSFTAENFFRSGQWEVTMNAGPMFSPFIATGGRPTVNYIQGGIQIGYMLSDLRSDGWLRGNWEIVPEVFGSGIFDGNGTYATGTTLWFRYNFVLPMWRLIPYAQAGGGFTFTDIDRNVIGQNFNFNLDVAVGFRVLLAPNWSLNLEYRYEHISDANLGGRNVGINAHGPMVGVSRFF